MMCCARAYLTFGSLQGPVLWHPSRAMTPRIAWLLLVLCCTVHPLRADGDAAFGRREDTQVRLVDARSRSPRPLREISGNSAMHARLAAQAAQAAQACNIFKGNSTVLACCMLGYTMDGVVPKLTGWKKTPKGVQKMFNELDCNEYWWEISLGWRVRQNSGAKNSELCRGNQRGASGDARGHQRQGAHSSRKVTSVELPLPRRHG